MSDTGPPEERQIAQGRQSEQLAREKQRSGEGQSPQRQPQQPGIESRMKPRPQAQTREYRGSGKLEGRVALITGGDSGIGRSVAVYFAREGADVAIVYLDEHDDAQETRRLVEKEGRRCIVISGDVGDESFCRQAVQQTIDGLGHLDVLVNNAAVQFAKDSISEIDAAQLEKTFRTNVYSHFFLTRAALPFLKPGSSIIGTTSVTAYRGSSHLVDYAATKGAIVAFTRSLASQLADRDIRVNAVAPGPIWTPLIPASFPPEHLQESGTDTPLGRAGQPDEVAPC